MANLSFAIEDLNGPPPYHSFWLGVAWQGEARRDEDLNLKGRDLKVLA